MVISAGAGFFLLPRASARKIDKSIAVLPFQNLSDEKENAYFADGMQDDILTNLSKIGDLKVISRMSVMSYRGDGVRNAREIGKALGVATLLEGSVRRIGNRVRVNVQLIDANNDEHIWAEDYDRDLTDVFAIQTDLAQKIASALQAKLSPNEKARLDRRPTQNSDAYLLFVQAHDYANRPDMFRDTSLKAEELFEQAIKLDPNFAAGFCRALDGGELDVSQLRADYRPGGKKRVSMPMKPCDCNRTFRKDISLSVSLIIMAIAITSAPSPNLRSQSAACRTKPKPIWPSAPFSDVRASGRNQPRIWKKPPRSIRKTQASCLILAYNYMALRNFEAADKTFDRAIAAAPQSFRRRCIESEPWRSDGKATLAWPKNNCLRFRRSRSEWPGDWARFWVLTLQRKFPEALQVVQQFRGETLIVPQRRACPKAFLEGMIYLLQGDKAKAQAAFEQARMVAEQLCAKRPTIPARHAQHGLILAALGQKQEAITEGKRAVELLPESQDAFDGPQVTAALAQIYAWTGESDEAFRLLDHLLVVPNGLTVPMLKLDPVWDPLRKDPRFQALIDKYSPKT